MITNTDRLIHMTKTDYNLMIYGSFFEHCIRGRWGNISFFFELFNLSKLYVYEC